MTFRSFLRRTRSLVSKSSTSGTPINLHHVRKLTRLSRAWNEPAKRYDGYKSFQYLEPGVDYKEYKLVKELNRVPSKQVEVSPEEEARVKRLFEENLVISLHDHCFVALENLGEFFEFRRQGRDCPIGCPRQQEHGRHQQHPEHDPWQPCRPVVDAEQRDTGSRGVDRDEAARVEAIGRQVRQPRRQDALRGEGQAGFICGQVAVAPVQPVQAHGERQHHEQHDDDDDGEASKHPADDAADGAARASDLGPPHPPSVR